MGVHLYQGLLVTITPTLQALRTAAFFLVVVDKPLDLPRLPVPLVQVEFTQGPAHQAVLVVRIQDLKAAGEASFLMVRPQ